MKPCVLFLYNTSEYAYMPWLAGGFMVATCDLQLPTGAHREGDVIRLGMPAEDARLILWEKYGISPCFVVAFPPCTDLTVAGAKHWERKREADPEFQHRAAYEAQRASRLGVPYVIENPVGALSTLWRKPDVWVHPNEFGGWLPENDVHPEAPQLYPPRDAYRKKTGLWLGNGASAPRPRPVDPVSMDNPGWAKLGGKSARTKYLRSLTPRGLAIGIFLANARVAVETNRKLCYAVPEQLEMDI